MGSKQRTTKIVFNEVLIRRIVYAIFRALTEDFPQARRGNRMETNNRFRMAAGDFVNENLRSLVVDENVTLIPFSRGGWEGRILVDNLENVTYSIMRRKTLHNAIKNKKRLTPYYLQTLLVNENGDCRGHSKQLHLFGEEPTLFSKEEFKEDFDQIMQGQIDKTKDYRHYTFVYETKKNEITDIRLLFLDGDYAEIDSADLKLYLTPDFASLTSNVYEEQKHIEANVKEKHNGGLVKVRPGVKPLLRDKEQEA